MSAQRHKPRHHNQQHDRQLNAPQKILQSQSPFQRTTMNEERSRDTRQSNASLIPPRNFHIRSMKNVFAKHHGVTACPTKKKHVRGVQCCTEELGTREYVFEVVLLASISGEPSSELEVDESACESDDDTNHPDEEREAYRAGEGHDGRWSCEDTGSDHTIEYQKDGRDETELPAFRGDDVLLRF